MINMCLLNGLNVGIAAEATVISTQGYAQPYLKSDSKISKSKGIDGRFQSRPVRQCSSAWKLCHCYYQSSKMFGPRDKTKEVMAL